MCGPLLLVFLAFLYLADMDLPYLVRVMVHRNASTSDHLWKATEQISPADRPLEWPRADGCAATREAFAGTVGVASMDEYLRDGGAQALVVIHEGSLTCEWYGNGGAAHTPAAAFSISKSVLALLVDRAVADGSLADLDEPITRHVPELRQKDPRFANITVQDLLDMRSGIAFSDEVRFPWVNQDQAEIYYASDVASTSIDESTIVSPPGPFTYNDFAPNLVGLALARASGESLAHHMQSLWNDIGAQDPAAWCVDDRGFAWHESGLVATARDLARVGNLFLTRGIANGRQVAPRAYLQRGRDDGPQGMVVEFGGIRMGYGNGWWFLPRSDGTHDIVAMGNLGQVVLVSPANRTVVVRMGTDHVTESNAEISSRLQRVADLLAQ